MVENFYPRYTKIFIAIKKLLHRDEKNTSFQHYTNINNQNTINKIMPRALSILLLALCVLPTWSWDFCQKNKDGVMLYYNFYDDDFQMCEVAYNKDAQYSKFDTLWIPDVVILPNKYEGWGGGYHSCRS